MRAESVNINSINECMAQITFEKILYIKPGFIYYTTVRTFIVYDEFVVKIK